MYLSLYSCYNIYIKYCCDKLRHINTVDYITSYDNFNLPVIIGSFRSGSLMKVVMCPSLSVTFGIRQSA